MAIFTAIATAIAGAIGLVGTAATIFTAVTASVLAIGVSRLVAKRMASGSSGGDAGGRVQLPPATDNKIPVVYGSAFVSGPVIDAKISSDNKTMWYVVALAEHTDTTAGTGYTFLDTYYDGKYVEFASPTSPNVTALVTNNASPSSPSAQRDTRMAGNLFIYKFTNGSSSGVNTGGLTAIQILQDSQIPVAQRWTANHTMTNCAFVIVKVIYNQDKGVVSLGSVMAQLSNNLNKPGDVIKDYLLNTRYGCGVPLARIDTASLTDLNTYSDATITYTPVGGGSATQPRYRINGPLDTANNCLDNLSILVDACDSWLQYSELTGQWRVVMNKGYAQAPNAQTLNQLFAVNDDNLVGGIQLSPIDLNSTYNQVEVAYPNKNIKDQTDYQIVDLTDSSTAWYDPTLLSPNEAINKLNLQLPVVNEAVQAKYIAVRRLLQSREDLIIQCQLDYSGIQIDAGDVIRVTNNVYGWTDKLFRVSNVAEEKYPDGSLGVSITAFEYNNTIFNDNAIQDFVPDPNTGLLDPNALSQPGVPTIANNPAVDGQVKSFKVTSYVPDFGTILYMDFNYGNTSNVELHQLYRTVQVANGTPFTNSDSGNAVYSNVAIDINDLPGGNYYFSTTGRNDFSGRASNASVVFNWTGANLNANTVPGNTIQPNTLSGNTLIANTVNGNALVDYSVTSNKMSNTGVVAGSYTNTNLTVDSAGRITTASNGSSTTTVVVQEAGSNIVTTGTLNFTGAGVDVSNVSNTANIYIVGYYNSLGSVSFQVANLAGNTVTLPVDITGTATRNIPVYIPGTDPGANYYYPFFQGESLTTDFYAANSTAAMTPAYSSLLEIDDGDDNWYRVMQVSLSQSINSGQTLVHNYVIQLVSDTDNTLVQIIPGMTVANATYDVVFTPFLTTIELNANLPYFHEVTRLPQVIAGVTCDKGGLWIRNMTAGSNVYCILGQYVGRGPL